MIKNRRIFTPLCVYRSRNPKGCLLRGTPYYIITDGGYVLAGGSASSTINQPF